VNKNRLSLILAALTAVAIAVGGFFLGVQPQLASASADEAQQTQTDQTNATSRAELDRLRERFTTLDAMQASLDGLRDSVPATADTDAFIRSLDTVAGTSGAAVSSVSVGEAQAYSAPASGTAPATAEAAPGAAASPSATATAEPSAEASPTAPAAPSVTTNPLVTPANFSVIPVSISIEGSYDQALAFTGGVQDGKRLFLITTLTSSSSTSAEDGAPDGAGRQTWTLGGFLYVLSAPAAATASATATATPTAS
jgi:Tfp pilus assembly protein PilO